MHNPLDSKDIDIFNIRCQKSPCQHSQKTFYNFILKSRDLKVSKPNTQYNCIIKMNFTKPSGLAAHLRYIMREGAGIDGQKPELFNDEKTYVKAGHYSYNKANHLKGEKRVFKFVISPEAGEIMDLKSFTKRVMKGLEDLQGQTLNWVAAVHGNTAQPHVHVVVRGIDKNGKNVVLKKEIIRSQFRELCKKDISLNYGEKSFFQARRDEMTLSQSHNITKFDRSINRKVEKLKAKNGYCSIIPSTTNEYQRLLYLAKLGYAKKQFVSGKNFYQKGFLIRKNFFDELSRFQKSKDIAKSFYEAKKMAPLKIETKEASSQVNVQKKKETKISYKTLSNQQGQKRILGMKDL